MIDDEDHPQMRKAAAVLLDHLKKFIGLPPTGRTLRLMNDLVVTHRDKCRIVGIDFPMLTVLSIPRLGVMDLLRADLEGAPLELRIVGFARRHPQATPQEIAQAVRWAFPSYRGGMSDQDGLRHLLKEQHKKDN